MQKIIMTVGLFVAISLVACDEPPGNQGQQAPVPPLEWKLGGSPRDRFELVGHPGKGTFHASGKILELKLFDLGKGTKFEIGSEKDTIPDESIMTLNIDISPQLIQAKLRDVGAAGKLDLGLTLKLELPDHRKCEIPLPPLKMSLTERFNQVRSGAILFGTEPEDSAPADSLVLADETGWEIFGQAGKLFELDWIAVMDRLPQEGTKRCSEYKKNKNLAPFSEITLRLKKTDVTIYDRRTGNVVKKKTFNASGDCPKLVFRTANADPEQDSTVPHADIKAWLRQEMAAKK